MKSRNITVPYQIADSGLKPLDFAVVFAMLKFANWKTGVLKVGQNRLAKEACISKRSVQRVVKQLVSDGLIRVDIEGDGYTPTQYTILCIAEDSNVKSKPLDISVPASALVTIEQKKYDDDALISLALEQVGNIKNPTALRINFEKKIQNGVMYDGKILRGVKTDCLRIEKIKHINNPFGFPINPASL